MPIPIPPPSTAAGTRNVLEQPMTQRGQWAPKLVAGRQARPTAARVDLTAGQTAELGDVTDIRGWVARARALMARDGVPAAAFARATGLATGTLSQRLRRYLGFAVTRW